MSVDESLAELIEVVDGFKGKLKELKEENDRLKQRLKKAEEVMSNYGFVAGMLDVCEGGGNKPLLNLCHESRDKLREASDAYWRSLKPWEVPIWQTMANEVEYGTRE